MDHTSHLDEASASKFFEGRILVEILSWDWPMRLAITRGAQDCQLVCDRDFVLRGTIRAPQALRGKSVKVVLRPFGPKVRFGKRTPNLLGEIVSVSDDTDFDLVASLKVPESAIPTVAALLATAWKYLQILTFDEVRTGASVEAFFFDTTVPSAVRAWADA